MTIESPEASGGPPVISEAAYHEVAQSEEFGRLRKAFRGFVFPVTIAFFLWYALYVFLSAYARDFMGTEIVGNINVGLVFGLLQFVSTFVIAWLYARFAGQKLDPVADKLRHELEDATSSDATSREVTP
jgi:uncharacterized membrane protein (DUF485 family)